MRATRHKISLLKNRISDNLPDDNDIFGYAGISKTLILDSLTESYNLLSVLDEYNDKFETILAKRNVAQFIDNANNYLSDTIKSDAAVEKFNDFLINISQLRFNLKEAYITLSEKPLRLDTEIKQAKAVLDDLLNDLEELKKIKEEIVEIKANSTEFIGELEAKHKTALENDKTISDAVENIESIDSELEGTNEKIKVWKSEIQTVKEDISSKQAEITKLKTEIEQIQTKNKESQLLIDKFSKTLTEQLDTNKEQQEYIQQTIEDVSRAGMAGSFKKRKDELRWTQFIWASLTIISVSGLIWLSYSLVKPLLSGQELDLNQLYFKIPVIASAVWLGWFCSKQYGFTTRIREDYAYKYAISLAFEGYKNETREIDEELLQKLVQLTIFNISKSPVSIFDTKSNPGSPYNEMFENIVKRFFGDKSKTLEE